MSQVMRVWAQRPHVEVRQELRRGSHEWGRLTDIREGIIERAKIRLSDHAKRWAAFRL